MSYKFVIKKTSNKEFRVHFEYNGEKVFWTESYTAKASANNAINAIKMHGPSAVVIDKTRKTKPTLEELVLTSAMKAPFALIDFVAESNRIEGINGVREGEVEAHLKFINTATPTIDDLVALVAVLQPNAELRDRVNVSGVRVGNHIAPPSGPEIRANLESVLSIALAFQQHVAYETLHPFTDGNGRSGRALWLHRMIATRGWPDLGFLHTFYYQTLDNTRL